MKKFPKTLFAAFAAALFAWPVYNFYKVDVIYDVVDKYTLQVQSTFEDRTKAYQYVDYYKESHDYIVQEVKK